MLQKQDRQLNKRGNGELLLLTHHLRLKIVNDNIKKHLVFLIAKKQVENMFTPPPFILFHTGFSLRKDLFRAIV